MKENTNRKMGQKMIILAWVVFLGLITLSFNHYFSSEQNEVYSVDGAEKAVILKRNRNNNHYVTTVLINGVEVNALLDTGASVVSIPEKIAKKLKLRPGLRYTAVTANGEVTVHTTILDSVQIGNIKQTRVRASINPNMTTDFILLGMSFLGKLELIQNDNQLTLKQR